MSHHFSNDHFIFSLSKIENDAFGGNQLTEIHKKVPTAQPGKTALLVWRAGIYKGEIFSLLASLTVANEKSSISKMRVFLPFLPLLFLSSCATGPIIRGVANMGTEPTLAVRKAQIKNEPRGDFYYGRRYFVEKTRFWGYLRKPGQSARSARLVIFNESKKLTPDRFPEDGPPGRRHGFDQNYQYRIYGRYTNRILYEPNSHQFLPEFELHRYELLEKNPSWLFSPLDHYDPTRITLLPW
jgi:hypothetical protein